MNNKTFITVILLSLALPVFILLLNLNLQIYNDDFYMDEFEKNNVYSNIEKETAVANYGLLLGYFKDDNNLDATAFNDKEKTHLADVYNLFKLSRYVLYGTIVMLLFSAIYFIKKKELLDFKMALIFGNVLSIIVLVFLSMLLLLDFSGVFESFHFAAFSNDLWQLNPATDKLIVMFPEEFFFDSVVNIVINSIATIIMIFAVVSVLGFYIQHKSKIALFDFKPEQQDSGKKV